MRSTSQLPTDHAIHYLVRVRLLSKDMGSIMGSVAKYHQNMVPEV